MDAAGVRSVTIDSFPLGNGETRSGVSRLPKDDDRPERSRKVDRTDAITGLAIERILRFRERFADITKTKTPVDR